MTIRSYRAYAFISSRAHRLETRDMEGMSLSIIPRYTPETTPETIQYPVSPRDSHGFSANDRPDRYQICWLVTKDLRSHDSSVCVCVRNSHVCSIFFHVPLTGRFSLQPWNWALVYSDVIGYRPRAVVIGCLTTSKHDTEI